ncbi:hypothetical protein GCM10023184_37160 [Flaviaesturariibacter amylovorans]|uniref:Uncharacterized protein n=1 Tax=Flaviaesturariibacter amylovorans TaxID=1084520 RepID=A0ABP8HIG5_9BACT
MDLTEITSLPLPAQLQELEHAYAECIIDADPAFLTRLWNEIKKLRKQLALPVYEYVTPVGQRV